MSPQIIRTVQELKALDPDTVVLTHEAELDSTGHVTALLKRGYTHPDYQLPAVVLATGAQVRAARAALEERTDGEKKYTVRYYNPIMGVYETHWDTQEEAEKEAAYDHGMNGAPTRVLDPDGNEIATFEEGQRHD